MCSPPTAPVDRKEDTQKAWVGLRSACKANRLQRRRWGVLAHRRKWSGGGGNRQDRAAAGLLSRLFGVPKGKEMSAR